MKNRFKAHKLRTGRYSERGRIYLVTVCCFQRRPVIRAFSAGRLVVSAMRFVEEEVTTLAFVVMPDHVHWLIQVNEGGELSSSVQKMKSWASRQIHLHTDYKESVWGRSFHDRAVRRCDDLKPIARYIILNPIRAGLVQRIGYYPLWDCVWL